MNFESDRMGLEREMNDLRINFESERMGLERNDEILRERLVGSWRKLREEIVAGDFGGDGG